MPTVTKTTDLRRQRRQRHVLAGKPTKSTAAKPTQSSATMSTNKFPKHFLPASSSPEKLAKGGCVEEDKYEDVKEQHILRKQIRRTGRSGWGRTGGTRDRVLEC